MFGRNTWTWDDYSQSLDSGCYIIVLSAMVLAALGVYCINKHRMDGKLLVAYFIGTSIPALFGLRTTVMYWIRGFTHLGKAEGDRMTYWDWVDSVILFSPPLLLGILLSVVLFIIAVTWYFKWRAWHKATAERLARSFGSDSVPTAAI